MAPQFVVCMTYDFDALSGRWRPPDYATPAPTSEPGLPHPPPARPPLSQEGEGPFGRVPPVLSRGEFGILGMERILELLASHGVSGSFFVPGHTVETFPAMTRKIHEQGHEIAHHGWTHRRPDDIYAEGGVEAERAELERGIEAIRAVTGAAPTGYRSVRTFSTQLGRGGVPESGRGGDC